VTFTAPGAVGAVTFVVTGALPAGLTWSSAGSLNGTPTQAGAFPLTITATDQSSGCSGSQAVTLQIIPTGPQLTLDRTALGFGAVTTGVAFVSQTAAQIVRLTQSGGTATWTATPGSRGCSDAGVGHGSAELTISVIAVPGAVGVPLPGRHGNGDGRRMRLVRCISLTYFAWTLGAPFGVVTPLTTRRV
jgi:hypothetical protein